jgi:hypothetical protein
MNFFDIVVPMKIRIPAKLYCFVITSILRSDISSCLKLVFLCTRCHRKSDIHRAPLSSLQSKQNVLSNGLLHKYKAQQIIEGCSARAGFYGPPLIHTHTNIHGTTTSAGSSDLTFDHMYLKPMYFNLFLIHSVHVTSI